MHAVSVGEVVSIVPLLKSLRAALPDTPLFVSTTTLTGRALAESKLVGLCDGVFFAPVDFPFAVRRVLRRLTPALVINLETEIWPGLVGDPRIYLRPLRAAALGLAQPVRPDLSL